MKLKPNKLRDVLDRLYEWRNQMVKEDYLSEEWGEDEVCEPMLDKLDILLYALWKEVNKNEC